MNPGRILKLGAVFVAGVAISVGGSLLYFLAQDRTQTAPVAPVSRPTTPQRQSLPRQNIPPIPPSQQPELAKVEAPSHVDTSGATADPPPSPAPKIVPARKKPSAGQPDSAPARLSDAARTQLAKPIEPKATDSTEVAGTAPPAAQKAKSDTHVETASPKPQVLVVPSGTYLSVRLGEPLSTRQNNAGDSFRGTLDSALIVNGLIVAERGSPVTGQIVNAREAGLTGGASELVLRLTQINTANGQILPVETNLWERQGAHGGLAHSAKKAGGAVVGVFAGAISGAAKAAGMSSSLDNVTPDKAKPANQKTVVLPKDTELTFNLATPVTISEKLASR